MTTDSNALPELDELFRWAVEAKKETGYSAAAKRWALIRRAFPNHPRGWWEGVEAHLQAGEIDAAGDLLAKAQETFPNHPMVLTEAAMFAIAQNQHDKAAQILARLRSEHPEEQFFWMKSADYAKTQQDHAGALNFNAEARARFAERPEPWRQFAELAEFTEDWAAAMQRWELFRERFPDNPQGFLRGADAAYKAGNGKEARRLLLQLRYGKGVVEENREISPMQIRRKTLTHLLELIWTRAVLGLQSEVHRSYLSYGWWILEPVIHMAVFYFVFGTLLNRGGEHYAVFLLTGLVPWTWFMKAVIISSASIIGGQNLMLQVGLPAIVFPLTAILQTSIKQIPVFLLLLGFVWWQGFPPTQLWWWLPALFICEILMILVVGCAVAAIIPFVRDFSHLVPNLLTLLMFLSGIFYNYRTMSAAHQELFLMNPVASLLESYRDIFLNGTRPDMAHIAVISLYCLAGFVVVIFSYRRVQHIYPRLVLE